MAEKESQKVSPSEPQAKSQEKKPSALSGILAVLVALLVVAVVFCGVFYFILKNNIFGLGEAYRPYFQDSPVLKLALPPLPETVDPEDPKNLSQEDIVKKYNEYRKKTADLAKQLEEANKKIAQLEKDAQDLSANKKILEEDQKVLQSIEDEKKKIEEIKASIAEMAATGDKAGFKDYFSQLDKETAAAIYKELLREDMDKEALTAIAKPFSIMEPASAARVLSELWSKDQEILISIMEGLKPQASALIMEKMDASVAAEVMRTMADRKLGRSQQP